MIFTMITRYNCTNQRMPWLVIKNDLEQLQQFGIFCFPNLGVWQLPKCYGKGKKGQSPIVSHNWLAKMKSWAHDLVFCCGKTLFRAKSFASSRQEAAATDFHPSCSSFTASGRHSRASPPPAGHHRPCCLARRSHQHLSPAPATSTSDLATSTWQSTTSTSQAASTSSQPAHLPGLCCVDQ